MLAPMRSRPTLAVVLALALAGCGGQTDEQEVRDVVSGFAEATSQKDYQRLCDEIFAPELLETLGQIGLPCEIALERAYADLESPRVVIGAIEVDGNEATAQVRSSAKGQQPSDDTLELVRVEDRWRIADLGAGSSEQPPEQP